MLRCGVTPCPLKPPHHTTPRRRYVHRLFSDHLAPKVIAGRTVTAPQLSRFVSAYASLFSERHGMPEAKMLLEATSDASNRIAVDAARAVFERAATELFAGPYVSDDDARAALAAFDEVSRATGGCRGAVCGWP